jgi:hypothetical protein
MITKNIARCTFSSAGTLLTHKMLRATGEIDFRRLWKQAKPVDPMEVDQTIIIIVIKIA